MQLHEALNATATILLVTGFILYIPVSALFIWDRPLWEKIAGGTVMAAAFVASAAMYVAAIWIQVE